LNNESTFRGATASDAAQIRRMSNRTAEKFLCQTLPSISSSSDIVSIIKISILIFFPPSESFLSPLNLLRVYLALSLSIKQFFFTSLAHQLTAELIAHNGMIQPRLVSMINHSLKRSSGLWGEISFIINQQITKPH